jgi:fatty-acyl-CoA synthase
LNDWYAKQTSASLLGDAAQRWGEREVLSHDGQRWSFIELQTAVDVAARGFIALGIERGDKVALWMPNRAHWIIAFFALSKIGAITVPVNTRFRAVDLEYVIRQSDACTLETVDRSGPMDYLAITREVIAEIESADADKLCVAKFPALKRVIVCGDSPYSGTRNWDDMLRMGATVSATELERRHTLVDPDDTTLILYTSGTTGFPKGVMHSHNIQRTVADIANRLGYRSDDVVLMNWPLFRVVGLYVARCSV